MKVRVVKIAGTDYYKLVSVEGFILPYTPEWKTEAGAKRWAKKNNFDVVD